MLPPAVNTNRAVNLADPRDEDRWHMKSGIKNSCRAGSSFSRMGQHFLIAMGMILISLCVGIFGYAFFEKMSFLDALLKRRDDPGRHGAHHDLEDRGGKNSSRPCMPSSPLSSSSGLLASSLPPLSTGCCTASIWTRRIQHPPETFPRPIPPHRRQAYTGLYYLRTNSDNHKQPGGLAWIFQNTSP